MRPDEARGLARLAGDAAGGVATQIQEMHTGIAGRVFGVLGPVARGIRTSHDTIAAGAYTGARALTGALVRGGIHAYGLTRSDTDTALTDLPRTRIAVGALNGAFGDLLERTRSPLATETTVLHRGRQLVPDPGFLAAALPGARPRLVIFLHGLCETEDAWRLGAERRRPYPDGLEVEQGMTALTVRYNSGRHISDNGRDLAARLEALVAAWPVTVSEIAFVGHSMGGLVARSACHYGADGTWVPRVRKVVMLGVPHHGAPLERAANAATAALSVLPETRALARPLRARSVGVKDLGYGYVVDEDWEGHDPDALWTDTGTEIPFLDSAEHFFVSATLTRDPRAPLARVFGDLLVLRSSAWAHRRTDQRMRFPLDRYRHIGGASHFTLLNHPAIDALLVDWLGQRALPAPRRALPAPA
ncbi:MAG: alpha/beta hydrolase [Actinomycetota bacterium]|nr:alpha/beta hydrolase [Actinomycetota bacterium]